MIAVLLWVLVAGGIATVALRLGPLYMEFLTVRSVMNALAEDPQARGTSSRELARMVTSRLDVNQVAHVQGSDFSYGRPSAGEGTDVAVAYEVRRHLGFNVDAVVMFDHRVTIPPK
ncbi:DUF4845 domain-containing protein [Thiococcus pfennigii]|jgi:hypothetical protein|uniref:DUF4845 domain-containing protein n=1 Tax=Thiococcus pfennigii TaxID=1057 RepID=UPI001907415C|nr:DUF4845 domain-containing protein [Thiococcus pfennigii]